MPADDLYWNPMMDLDHHSDRPSNTQTHNKKPYIDPWDLENYAYIRDHLGSVELNSSDPSSSLGDGSPPESSNSTYYYASRSGMDEGPVPPTSGPPETHQQHHYYESSGGGNMDEDNEKLYESFTSHHMMMLRDDGGMMLRNDGVMMPLVATTEQKIYEEEDDFYGMGNIRVEQYHAIPQEHEDFYGVAKMVRRSRSKARRISNVEDIYQTTTKKLTTASDYDTYLRMDKTIPVSTAKKNKYLSKGAKGPNTNKHNRDGAMSEGGHYNYVGYEELPPSTAAVDNARRRRHSEQPLPPPDYEEFRNQTPSLAAQRRMSVQHPHQRRQLLPPPMSPPLVEYESDFEESPYDEEEDLHDSTMMRIYDSGNRGSSIMALSQKQYSPRLRSSSYSYGDYEYDPYRPIIAHPSQLYGPLEDVYGSIRPTLYGNPGSPIYDDIRAHRSKPEHFQLSNYGHLKIDYSCSWQNLNKYISN